jgi:uncharacterized protein (DUF2141 family)
MTMLQTILFSLHLPLLFQSSLGLEEQVKLVVEIDNIRHTEGQILRLAVERKEEFLGQNTPFDYAIIEVHNGKLTHSFSLPKGEYAVSVYHDLNGNDKLDKNIFGAPIEPYGFSRNYKPVMRAPKFDEVKISLNQDRKIGITLLQP